MHHPVLDAFDRLVEALDLFTERDKPRAVLLFVADDAPMLLAMDGARDTMLPVAMVVTGGHKRLAFAARLPRVIDAAAAFQASLSTVPGLSEAIVGSALAFAFDEAGGKLLFTWWPTVGPDYVDRVFDGFLQGDVDAAFVRSCLVQAIANAPESGAPLVPCDLFDETLAGVLTTVTTHPAVLTALEGLLYRGLSTRVGVAPRVFVQPTEPPTVSPVLDSTREQEVADVRDAYHHLVATIQQAPEGVTDALFYTDDFCYFYEADAAAPQGEIEIKRPGARHQPCDLPHRQAPGNAPPSWHDEAAEAWQRFVGAFPAGRQWAHTHPMTELDTRRGPAKRHAPLVDLHLCSTYLTFSLDQVEAWLTPQGARPFFVQVEHRKGIFRVDADTEHDAIALACRLFPPATGYPAQIHLWDMWQG